MAKKSKLAERAAELEAAVVGLFTGTPAPAAPAKKKKRRKAKKAKVVKAAKKTAKKAKKVKKRQEGGQKGRQEGQEESQEALSIVAMRWTKALSRGRRLFLLRRFTMALSFEDGRR